MIYSLLDDSDEVTARLGLKLLQCIELHFDPDQSYIGLPVEFQRLGFFPDIGHRFTVLTDDDKIFTCVRAQANGKGIETPQDNSEIGRYFRNRLGLKDGAYISVSDLKEYGRFDVIFYKLDDENYVMDFSRP